MKRMAIRLERLEERLPPPVPATEERPPVHLAAVIAEIKAESARVDALPPAEKILAIKAKIAKRRSRLLNRFQRPAPIEWSILHHRFTRAAFKRSSKGFAPSTMPSAGVRSPS